MKRQIFRALQRFRDQLSERTLRSFGVPLRTTEAEITVEEPRSPDVYIGRVFDHNWELLSPVVPVWLVKGAVRRHFTGKLPYMVEKNLSRLASQWTDSLNDAMTQIGKEAERRLDELVSTVERLIASSSETAPQIRADLERISSVRDEFGEAAFRGAEAEQGRANHRCRESMTTLNRGRYLNEHQRQRLLITCRYVDKLLSDAEEILNAAASKSPFLRWRDDTSSKLNSTSAARNTDRETSGRLGITQLQNRKR